MRSMRTVIVVTTMLIIATGSATAQRSSFFAGVSGGFTLGDLHDPAFDTDARIGMTAGLLAGARPTRNTVVNLGAHWVQKGGGDTRLDYLEIPITLGGVALFEDGHYRSRFYTGIAMSVKLGCSSEPVFLSCSDASNVEWVWPIGLLLSRWSRGSQFFAVDIRYTEGLSDAFQDVAISNRSWQVRFITGLQLGGSN